MSFDRTEYPRSRKDRVCEECDGPIAGGEKYARLTWYEPEAPGVMSFGVCLRCWAMRSAAWEVLHWRIEDAPTYGDLRSTLIAEWKIPDPEAWLDGHLARQAEYDRWQTWSVEAVAVYAGSRRA